MCTQRLAFFPSNGVGEGEDEINDDSLVCGPGVLYRGVLLKSERILLQLCHHNDGSEYLTYFWTKYEA